MLTNAVWRKVCAVSSKPVAYLKRIMLPPFFHSHTFLIYYALCMTLRLFFIVAALLFKTACARTGSEPLFQNGAVNYSIPQLLATLEDSSVMESSGIVASRLNPGLFWTHNDSGDKPLIFAFDLQGKSHGTWFVSGANAFDWEDIAIGPGPVTGQNYIYIGDIGDNQKRRSEIVVYRVPEPAASQDLATLAEADPADTEPAVGIRLKYPEGRYDAEALLVHPQTGVIYILTKNPGSASSIYRVPAKLDIGVTTLERVGEIKLPSQQGSIITGGDISPDGKMVILCDYQAGYEFLLRGQANSFDPIWTEVPAKLQIGTRRQGEAICYSLDGNSVLATSEGTPCPIFRITKLNSGL
jgi:hypothetical protein